MSPDEFAQPLRARPQRPVGPLADQVQVPGQLAARRDIDINAVQIRLDQGDQSGKVLAVAASSVAVVVVARLGAACSARMRAVDDLVDRHESVFIFDGPKRLLEAGIRRGGAGILIPTARLGKAVQKRTRSGTAPGEGILAEPEFLAHDGVACVRGLHVLCGPWDGDVEIQVEAQDGAGHEHDEDTKRRVLEVGDLDLHAAELDAPANIRVWRGRLEAHVLPIRALDVLEVVAALGIERLEVLGENDQRVPDEQVREVRGQEVVHAAVEQFLLQPFVDDQVRVHVLVAQARVLGNVGAVAGVTGFGDAPAVVLERLFAELFGRAVVDGARDLVPSHIRVDEKAFVDGRGGRQGQ